MKIGLRIVWPGGEAERRGGPERWDFGVFIVRPRKTGVGRNFKNGATVLIPAGQAVRFKPSKYIKVINSKPVD